MNGQAMIEEFRHDWQEEANVNKNSTFRSYQTPFDIHIGEVTENFSDWKELRGEDEADNELYCPYLTSLESPRYDLLHKINYEKRVCERFEHQDLYQKCSKWEQSAVQRYFL